MSILCSGSQNIRRLRVKSAKATQMAQAQRRVNEQRAHACIHIYLRSRLATLRMREVSLKRLSCTSQLFCELCALPSSRRRRGPSRFRASERKQTGASTRPNMTVSSAFSPRKTLVTIFSSQIGIHNPLDASKSVASGNVGCCGLSGQILPIV